MYRASTAAMLAAAFVMSSCEGERPPPPKHSETVSAPIVPWDEPEPIRDISSATTEVRTLDLADAQKYPECHELLEPNGEVADPFPLPDPVGRALALASCDIEATLKLEDGTRIYAWGAPSIGNARATDLHVAAWSADGKLRWTAKMNRTKQSPNWVANFRRSFLTAVGDRHVCFGTLWEGETQGQCVAQDTGEKHWGGSLPFWSGIVPQGAEDGFFVADISSVTKRYPFSGAEMRHLKLPGLGGRAGYYATDGKRLYFATSREEQPALTAYSFETFDPVWQTPLRENPNAALAYAYPQFELILMKLDDNLYAVDTETGKALWAHRIGDDIPSIAANGDSLFVLNRLPSEPNVLFAIEPRSGSVRWKAETPSGTLRVESIEDELVIGSVRAVQHVPLAATK